MKTVLHLIASTRECSSATSSAYMYNISIYVDISLSSCNMTGGRYWHLICFEFPGASHANQNQLLLSTEVTVPRSKFETVTQVYRKNINAKLLHLYYFPHQPQLSEEVTVPQSELEIRFKIPELVLERKQGWSSIKDKNSFVKTLIFFLYLQCPWMLV